MQDFERLIAWKRGQYRASGQTDIFDAGWPLKAAAAACSRPRAGELQARLFTLHAGNDLVAAHLALCNGPVAHAWFIAHHEAFARYSPGVMLIAETAEVGRRARRDRA